MTFPSNTLKINSNTSKINPWISFCEQLEQKNSEKKADAPNALVLTSLYDWNGALTFWSNRFLLSKIAATHRIYFSFLEKKEQIRESIHNTTRSLQHRINLLVFSVHGNSSHIDLGEKAFYTMEDVSSEDFAELDEKANIFLLSCRTGLGLAQKIADVANRTVFAPQGIPNTNTRLSTCSKHGLEIRQYITTFGSEESTEEITGHHLLFSNISGFQKGKPSFFCNDEREEDSLFFQEQMEFLKHDAESGNGKAQHFLGDVYFQKRAFAKAEKWYLQAIAHGEVQALDSLGFLWHTRGDLEKAESWYRKAIAEGDAEVQLSLGDLYYEKNELEKAEECWTKIIKDKDFRVLSQALFKLAELYFNKKKDVRKAMAYYQKAAATGSFEAQMKFLLFSQKIEESRKKQEGNKRKLEEGKKEELEHANEAIKPNSPKTREEPSLPPQKTSKISL